MRMIADDSLTDSRCAWGASFGRVHPNGFACSRRCMSSKFQWRRSWTRPSRPLGPGPVESISRFLPSPNCFRRFLLVGDDTPTGTPPALATAPAQPNAACDPACSRRRCAGARECPRQQSCSASLALADLAGAADRHRSGCTPLPPGSTFPPAGRSTLS